MNLPSVMLWAWERPEDLSSLDPRKAGVAFLAQTIEIRSPSGTGLGVSARPRLNSLRVPPGTKLMAVVRIETPNDLWHRGDQLRPSSTAEAPPYTVAQRERAAAVIAQSARLPDVVAVQIDFDAARSERGFYSALLTDVRRRLPARMPLSVTALASWCIGDPWLDDLPAGTIDEAVPMLFRMGPDTHRVAALLQSGDDFRSQVCRGSLGVSTDEPFSEALLRGDALRNIRDWSGKRIYVFPGRTEWDKSAGRVVEEIGKWHSE